MPKLSRYGALLQGALIVHVGPRLAQDAKLPDFKSILIGAPMTNRISQRAAIAQAVQTVTKPYLAQDADLDDVAEVLEALQRVSESEEDGEDGMEPNSAIPMVSEEDGLDEHPASAKIKAICEKHNLPSEVCAELAEAVGEEESSEGGLDFYDRRADDARRRMGRDETEEEREKREDDDGAEDARKRMGRDETEEEAMDRRAEDAARHSMRRARDAMSKMGKDAKAEDRKRANDAMRRARDAHRTARDMRMKRADDRKAAEDRKKAMDGMITKKEAEDMVKRAVDTRRAEDQAIIEAREFVRPWVGQITMACDSAEQVHREALKMLGEKDVDKLHVSALRPIIERSQRPDSGGSGRTYTMDSRLPDGVKPASERFANLGRHAVMG